LKSGPIGGSERLQVGVRRADGEGSWQIHDPPRRLYLNPRYLGWLP
jgi:hypothetical protein